jgi:hypothetical protein
MGTRTTWGLLTRGMTYLVKNGRFLPYEPSRSGYEANTSLVLPAR